MIGAAFVSLLTTWLSGGRVPPINPGIVRINWVDWWAVLLGLSFALVTLFSPKGIGVLLDLAQGLRSPDRKRAPLGRDDGSLQEKEASE